MLGSGEKMAPSCREPRSATFKHKGHTTFARGAAASILVALSVVGVYRGKLHPNAVTSQAAGSAAAPRPVSAAATPVDANRDALILQLQKEKRTLSQDIALLRASLAAQSHTGDQVQGPASHS